MGLEDPAAQAPRPSTGRRQQKHRPPTLRDVALAAGVHVGTASRALGASTKGLVATETVRRVTRAAEDLGYRGNAAARSLRTARSATVGVLVPDLDNPLFPPIVRGIEDVLGQAGFTVFVTNTDNDPRRDERAVAAMLGRQVDGLIIATGRRATPRLAELAEEVPLVTVMRHLPGSRASSVRGDEAGGIRSAVEHLAQLGHVQVAEIAGPAALTAGAVRHRAFVRAAREAGLSTRADWSPKARAFTEEEGLRAVRRILAVGCPSAIVAANDLLALGAIDGLREAGLSVPADVSVTGFNDMKLVDKLTPPLTTVRLDKLLLGREAARLMLDLLGGGRGAPEHVVIPCPLVIRGSAGVPHRR